MTATANTSERTTSTSKMVNSVFWDPIRSGTEAGSPYQSEPTFWRMNDIPIAVISGASLGAPRNGR